MNTLYQRAVAHHCLNADLWKEYITFLVGGSREGPVHEGEGGRGPVDKGEEGRGQLIMNIMKGYSSGPKQITE